MGALISGLLSLGLAKITALLAVFLAVLRFLLPKEPKTIVTEQSIQAWTGKSNLEGTTALVTGCTSGLGEQIARDLIRLGASVILLSRSKTKLEKLAATLGPKCTWETADVSDLKAVKTAAARIGDKGVEIDLLVNNAGIHYGSPMEIRADMNGSEEHNKWYTSAQGFDKTWATNYLGHYLLTELLLPHLSATARVVNIASSYHWHVDGEDLRVSANQELPLAAREDPSGSNRFRLRHLAYGNSKFAQILQAKSLQKRFDASTPQRRALAVCPGWVRTAIIPWKWRWVFMLLGFSSEVGVSSTFRAAFDPAIKGGSFVTNSNMQGFAWIPRLGWRDWTGHAFVAFMLLAQRFTWDVGAEPSAPETEDESLQDSLEAWSQKAIQPFAEASESAKVGG